VIYSEVRVEDRSETGSGLLSFAPDPEDLSTWMIQRYLKAVRSRAIPSNADSDCDWPMLNGLQYQLQQQLPSEYAERLDDVSARSMGSAKIAPDESGLVPWDKIWTSFCDLAMAGGPPHRGKLLEPVAIDRIEQSPEAYLAVVAEIRRGISLASGLSTCQSPYPGWVCIECDSEPMAAWLMRAILVENISVRRESTKLYLPAGPDYRVDKEIKNVITSVAKTHHYWQAHLRSRQPPKPL
jgi:sirohydrochlorin cobaltochelatase